MIRNLTKKDFKNLEEIFHNSFSEDEAPVIYDITCKIINEDVQPPTLCLGYEIGDRLVGAVTFSPVCFDSSQNINAYILSPIAVHKSHQKQGIASKLIKKSQTDLSDAGVDVLFVYGDPDYYGKFGFNVESARQFIPPYPLQYEFGWQAMMLNSTHTAKEQVRLRCVEALSDASLW